MRSLAQGCVGRYRRASREKPGEEVVFKICCVRELLPSIAERSVTRIAEVYAKRTHYFWDALEWSIAWLLRSDLLYRTSPLASRTVETLVDDSKRRQEDFRGSACGRPCTRACKI